MYFQKDFSARNIVVLFLAFFVFMLAVHGQTPTVTPGDETIRVKSDLIQTNVTAVDKNNRFVEGLKRGLFELRVDGKPVPLEFFEQIAVTRTNENPSTRMDTQKQNAASANPNLRGRNIIFFVDDLHLSLDSLGRTRSTIAHFIESEMMPRDSVLIVSASGQIGFLQQFTDNKAVFNRQHERRSANSFHNRASFNI
jgi:VWFA-related protein